MTSKINALSTGVGGLATSADASGILELQTNDTTAVTVDGSQVVSFDNNFGTVAGLPSYQCRAWVNLNGTGTVAIRASGNVSSITDNGTGDYTVNFTTAMVDNNFSTLVSGNPAFNGATVTLLALSAYNSTAYMPTTTATRVVSMGSGGNGTSLDVVQINVAIFR